MSIEEYSAGEVRVTGLQPKVKLKSGGQVEEHLETGKAEVKTSWGMHVTQHKWARDRHFITVMNHPSRSLTRVRRQREEQG